MKGTRVRDDKSIKIRLYKKEKVFFYRKKGNYINNHALLED